jgi:competence protein ComFB
MALEDRYNLDTIRNRSAEAVYGRVERLLLEREDVCKCRTCVLDLVAYTLNHVSPRYQTSLLGDLHPDKVREKRMEVEIDLALQAGVQRLREHTHHEP